jgi:hypothetical protein
MFCICLFGTLIYSRASPLETFALSRTVKGFLMGIAIAISAFVIIRSPFGRLQFPYHPSRAQKPCYSAKDRADVFTTGHRCPVVDNDRLIFTCW